MIRFHLKCDQNHQFESWFRSGDAFDTLVAGGHVACTVCGSVRVGKTMMSPAITPSGSETPVAALRRKIETDADYVGTAFASEARAIHDGEAIARPIYGEATPGDARKLIADGIPVLPLPFIPTKKAH